jgi:hypothetical protein
MQAHIIPVETDWVRTHSVGIGFRRSVKASIICQYVNGRAGARPYRMCRTDAQERVVTE